MQLGKIKQLYDLINGINPTVKTVIILLLVGIIAGSTVKYHAKSILEDYTQQAAAEKKIAEEYTQIISPMVNEYIQEILLKDRDASNVILLNYHNTLTSSHGLSYRYLTALTEGKRGIDSKNCLRFWKELEFINYEEEFAKINSNQYLRMDDVDVYTSRFPKITELLRMCNAKSAAFYPIEGIGSSIGMIVVLYPKKKEYYLGYYNEVIARQIQALSSLLDYDNMKEMFKKYPGSKFKPEFKKQYEN